MVKSKPDDVTGWELMEVLSKIKGAEEIDIFLKDLLTPGEYSEVKRRWQIIRLLNNGLTQRQVAKKIKIAIATVTRGARVLNNPVGGFNKVLKNKK